MTDHQARDRAPRSLSRTSLLRGLASTATIAAGAPLMGAAPAPNLDSLKRLLRVNPKYAGTNLTFDIGAVYPVTGPGNVFGAHITDIPKLAFRHIEMMGGPKFNLILKDNKSGDPQAGVQAARELGFAKVPMMLSSYVADLGAMLTSIDHYKIFSIDGSGGTSIFGEKKPYFWGSIAISPNDALSGMIKFIHKALPNSYTLSSIGWDLGPDNAIITEDAIKYFKGANMVQGVAEIARIGSTDFSTSLAKIKASEPDVVICAIYGIDVGYFMKQYALSGINKPVIAFSHTVAAQQVAGPAYEGLYFAYDYFDAHKPDNAWAKFYIEEFYKLEGPVYAPDNYGANTYEDCFIFWECIRRVLEKGGNPHDATQLDAALRSNPSFPSLYGGTQDGVGTIEFDLTTHSVKKRPMTVAQFKNGAVTPLAHFDIGGGNFRML